MGKVQMIKWMNKLIRIMITSTVLLSFSFINGCEEFFHPDQELILESDEVFSDWSEYRSAEMGLYSLMQNLVEQIVILGELRGDLLTITSNASPELREIHNFNISRNNPYISPVNFYKLILACNKLIIQLENSHPTILDETEPINNYDRLYGEVLCMRAWAYFNAVRIYGKVPYIYKSITDLDEIEAYINGGAIYYDSLYIDFAPDSWSNDTIRDTTFVLEKTFLDQKAVIDTFTNQLIYDIKATGVNHSITNDDITWQSKVWNENARHVLLGKMFMYDNNFTEAIKQFNYILFNNSSENQYIKFGLDSKFSGSNWQNIFNGIDGNEHILLLQFDKSQKQTHELQKLFSNTPPNWFMLKPTKAAVDHWETIWNNPIVDIDNANPNLSKVIDPGTPGDFNRGYNISYKYTDFSGFALNTSTVKDMLVKKLNGEYTDVFLLMQEYDTVVNKYSIGKTPFSHDADFIIYRAADIHLYAAEVFAFWVYNHSGIISTESSKSLGYLNDGNYRDGKEKETKGVRGRVGFADDYEKINLNNVIYQHDPVTNEIIGFKDWTSYPHLKQKYLIDQIMEERARELAFEGQRFYDLIRIAERMDDPAFLADRVAAKFNGSEREMIRSRLMDKSNWYIDYYW